MIFLSIIIGTVNFFSEQLYVSTISNDTFINQNDIFIIGTVNYRSEQLHVSTMLNDTFIDQNKTIIFGTVNYRSEQLYVSTIPNDTFINRNDIIIIGIFFSVRLFSAILVVRFSSLPSLRLLHCASLTENARKYCGRGQALYE